jgi:hypothetical protein
MAVQVEGTLMLLGLAVAVLLALMLQLNALRARRAQAFECAPDGVIHLKAWVVLEAAADAAPRVVALAARQVLMLPSRIAGALRRRLPKPRYWRPVDRAMLWRTSQTLRTSRSAKAAATGPPEAAANFNWGRWRSPRSLQTSPAAQRPPGPLGGRSAS